MPPSNLQGLNIVRPPQESGDPHDLLLGQAYPDLTAQLDLWTNLSFDSEDHLTSRHEDPKKSSYSLDEEEEEVRSPVTGEKAVQDGHVNVVTPANVSISQPVHHASLTSGAPTAFDINTFLAGFAVDAFAQHSQPQHPPTISPSLAQLLALHPGHNLSFNAGPPQYHPSPPLNFSRTPSVANEETSSSNKRHRTRKSSVTSVNSPDFGEESPTPSGLSPAEDKRRRNTAASARFRLKKKEREAALEGKAKELELKVTELERECEGLRRENGWLKGLVVGVTGAAQGPNAAQGLSVPSPPPGQVSVKRRKDDEQA